MKPTLLVLAAGMGSRYGGLKQLDQVGPNNETIIDYSIFDAVRGGFGKIVFVIRHDFETEFRNFIEQRFANHIQVEVVFQELDYLPEGFYPPADRTKPWGTNHAVLMGKSVIKEPFAVINADDFYGQESFKILADWLVCKNGKTSEYSMVGYRLGNTLSESGSVSRGICSTDKHAYLKSIVERTYIMRDTDGKIKYRNENDEMIEISDDTLVSMNMWGFTPDYFDYSERIFKDFLSKNITNNKSEFFIPLAINELIVNNESSCEVLATPSKWFGVTYKEDKDTVIAKIKNLIEQNVYPERLWK
jgi:choline kinase